MRAAARAAKLPAGLPAAASMPREQTEQERVFHLTAKARKGTHAILATRVVSIVVTFVSITLLARLIAPADFGIWAVASLALGLVSIVREFGLVSSILQARNLTVQQQNAYFWISAGLSVACAAAVALAAPLVARVYDAPLLRPVLLVASITLVIAGLGLVPAALLRRDLKYDKIALIEGGGMVCLLVTSVTAAYLRRDVWALVFGQIAQVLWVATAALVLCRWMPRRPQRGATRLDLSFSFQVTLYDLLTYAGNNVGVAAGYRMGATDLGFFNRGRQLCQVAHYALLTPLTEVGLSLLCRLHSERAYRSAYMALARRIAILFIPLAAVLPLVSSDLVVAVLGPAWAPSSRIVAWFAPALLGQAFASLFAQLMTSQGRGDELRGWAVVDLLLRGGGAVVGSQFGIVGLAAGFSLATFFLTLPLMLWIAGRSGPVQWRHQLTAAAPGVLLAVAALGGAALAAMGVETLKLAAWSRLLFVGGSAALSWAILCLALRPARDALLGKGAADE